MCTSPWRLLLLLTFGAALPASANDAVLIDAVKAGNDAAVRAALARHPDVNALASDGTTALHWAVRADDVKTVDLLLRAGARVEVASRLGVTPLSLASTTGNPAMIQRLLQAGADVNTTLPEGETVLMRAARTGNADTLRLLLDHGADPNRREASLGETALMWAAAENHADAVRVLVERGAEVDARSTQRSAPELQRMRRVRGVVTKGGWTPLMYAARQGSLDAVRALVESRASLDLTTVEGTTPLVLAIINAHYDVADLLLERGANPNVADQTGMAALYAAVDMHTLAWMKGRTPSKASESVDALTLTRHLLERGADPNAALRTPILMRHQTRGDSALGSGATPFLRAAKSGDVALMRLLVAHGADPKRRQQWQATALHLAAGMGWRTGDADANDQGSEQDVIDAIALCLELGLDINAVDHSGLTPLHAAIDRGDEVVKFLVARGARFDIRDDEGRTPLDLAERGIDAEVRGNYVRATTAALLRELMAAGK